MNDTDLISQLVGKTPKDWIHDAGSLLVLVALAGRAWHAWRNGGGLRGIWMAFMYGTNTPKPLAGEEPKP